MLNCVFFSVADIILVPGGYSGLNLNGVELYSPEKGCLKQVKFDENWLWQEVWYINSMGPLALASTYGLAEQHSSIDYLFIAYEKNLY